MTDIASAVKRVKELAAEFATASQNEDDIYGEGTAQDMREDAAVIISILAALEHQTARVAEVEKERDKLIAAVGEHVTVRVDYYARLQTAEAEITRLRAIEAAGRNALEKIANESVFNQQRFAEDTDTDYFLRCFGAVKKCAREALATNPAGGADE